MQHFTHIWNAGGSTNQDDVVNVVDLHFCILEGLLDWLERLKEEGLVQGFELCSSETCGEGFALVEIFNIDRGTNRISRKRRTSAEEIYLVSELSTFFALSTSDFSFDIVAE